MACENPEFIEHKAVTIRVPRKCCETGIRLLAGDKAMTITGKWAGEFASYTMSIPAWSLFEEASRINREVFQNLDDEGPGIGALRDWIIDSEDAALIGKWNAICDSEKRINTTVAG